MKKNKHDLEQITLSIYNSTKSKRPVINANRSISDQRPNMSSNSEKKPLTPASRDVFRPDHQIF